MSDLNASELIHLHKELREQQPSPTSTIEVKDDPDEDKALKIAGLLREIEPWCGWLRWDADAFTFNVDSWGLEIWVGGKDCEIGGPSRNEAVLLLGAICADCDARGWNWSFPNKITLDDDSGLWVRELAEYEYYAVIIYPVWMNEKHAEAGSNLSTLHALLLAYREALRAHCTCESEDGWHLADVCPLGGTSEELAVAVCPEHPLAEMTDGQCHDCETNERIAWDIGTGKVRGNEG